TIFHSSYNFDKFRVKSVNSKIDNRSFSYLDDFVINLLCCFSNYFFNSGWVNSTISNQFMKCQTSNFSSNRVKTRKDNRFRSIIYDNFNPCCCLKCSDVSTLTTNDSTFYVIRLDIEY